MNIDVPRLTEAIMVVSARVPIENLAPDTLAARLIGAIQRGEREPGADRALQVTEASLASALEGFYLEIQMPCDRSVRTHGQVADADALAAAVFATLSRMAALREPEPGDVVDASICCDHEHLPDDRELAVMAAFLGGMRWLAPDAQQRVRCWVSDRFAVIDPPF